MTPRFQVVPATTPQTVTLALRVSREGSDGEPATPLSGALLEATLEEGRGRLERAFATTNAQGVASVTVAMPAVGDKTRVVVTLESDERSWLPFEVVSAPIVPVEMTAGEIEDMDVPRDGVLLRLPGDQAAEYFLIPHQTDLDRSGAAYRFLHQAGAPRPNQIGFGMRGPSVRPSQPVGLGDPGHVAAGAITAEGLTPAADIPGQVNIKSCGIEIERLAPLRYLGERIALYVDAPREQHQARIDSLGRAFDQDIYATNTRLFGPTTDLDANDRVLVILSPELRSNVGIYCDTIRTFGVEAFYGRWTPSDPIDRALATLAHEHQHVINAGHHMQTRGAIGDERWLNEGMSYAAEALNGYWGSALIRVWAFLSGQNGGLPLLPLDYSPAFADETMMFLLYLRDRFGPDMYLALGRSGKAGVTNVEKVAGLPIEEILRDWFVANAVSNRGLTDDPRYRYESVNLQGMGAEIAACGCVPPGSFSGMNMEVLDLGAPFDVWRTLNTADADYYRLRAGAPSDPVGGLAPAYEVYYDAFGLQTTHLTIVRSR